MVEKSLKKNSIINFVKTVVGLLFPIITFPYVSRALGVEGIGKVNYANSLINYFVLFAGLGITNYAIREGAKLRDDKEQINKFCTEILIINIGSTFISYIGIIVFLKTPYFMDYRNLILLFSATIFFNIVGVSWLFNIFEEFTYITIRTLLFQTLSLFLLVFVVKDKSDYVQYAGILVFSSVGANIFNIAYSQRFVKFFPSGCKYELKKHINPILIIFGTSIATTIYLNIDTSMLGIQAGIYQVGLYTAATKISKIVASLISSVCVVFLPRLSYYIKFSETQKFNTLVDNIFCYILGFTLPASIGLLILSREIIVVFSGPEFLDSASTMMIKAPNIILSVINGFIAIQLFIPLGKEKQSLYATIAGAFINCLFNYIMIPYWGANGAAIATILAEGTVCIICLMYLKDCYTFGRIKKEICKYSVGSIGVFGVGIFVKNLAFGSVMTMLLTVFLGVGVYFFFLFILQSELLELLKIYIRKNGGVK